MEQPPASDTADGDDANESTAATDEANLQAETFQRLFQQRIEAQRAAVGDAEDICTAFVDNLFEDIFMEMRETHLNDRAFTGAAQMACTQVWDGWRMAGVEADPTLDATVNGHRSTIYPNRSSSGGQRQQILKPDYSDDVDNSPGATSPKRKPRCKEHSSGTAASSTALLASLTRLSVFLERERQCVETHLMTFDGSTFKTAAAGDKLAVGKWSIAQDLVQDFLVHINSVCLLSIPPSAIHFVLSSSAVMSTERKSKTSAISLLYFESIVALIQKAITLADQQLAEAIATAASFRGRSDQDTQASFFSTEVPTQLPNADPSQTDEGDIVLSCYKDESDPRPSSIDRNAPGTIVKKNAVVINATTRNLARKVVSAMKPAPDQNSRWARLRSKILLDSPIESSSARDDPVESTPPKPTVGSNTVSPKKKSAVLKATVAKAQTATVNSLSIQPDAAALSNIFSLGTPRQLSATELARRNDILSMLERDEEKRVRRMATASFVALTLPSDSQDNGSFQKYVSSISSVTISEGALVSGSALMTTSSNEPNSMGQKPKRPEPQSKRSAGRDSVVNIGMRSKFELEHDPPHYTISDGNIHSRSEQHGIDFAMCSPIKRSKVQRPMAQVGAKAEPPPVPTGSHSTNNTDKMDKEHLIRPVETDSNSHLPRLETSRLAIGVRAVVHGVEKHGPKRHPSRNARRQLHNYCIQTEDDDFYETGEDGHRVPRPPAPPPDPVGGRGHFDHGKTHEDQQQPRSFLPLIPPVSPIKASPHRKHVAFKSAHLDQPVAAQSCAMVPPLQSPIQTRGPATQPVWEKKTSPPRVRNHHFSTRREDSHARKRTGFYRFYADDEDSDSEVENFLKPRQMNAPRLNFARVDEDEQA